VLADFRAAVKQVAEAGGLMPRASAPNCGIVTTAQPAPAEPLTMEGLTRAITHLREHGFPRERRTVQVGDLDAFRRWIETRIPLVTDERVASANRLYGLDVLTDVELPPNVIEIREGDRVLRRIVLQDAP